MRISKILRLVIISSFMSYNEISCFSMCLSIWLQTKRWWGFPLITFKLTCLYQFVTASYNKTTIAGFFFFFYQCDDFATLEVQYSLCLNIGSGNIVFFSKDCIMFTILNKCKWQIHPLQYTFKQHFTHEIFSMQYLQYKIFLTYTFYEHVKLLIEFTIQV